MDHHISIEESLRFGWEKMRAHSTLIFQALLTLFGVQIGEQIVSRVLGGTLEGALATAVLVVLTIIIGIGFTVIMLRIAQGKQVAYPDIVPPVSLWLSYLIANLLAAVVSVVPLVAALIIYLAAFALLPSAAAGVVSVIAAVAGFVAMMYFALRYAFVRFSILDDTEIIKSLRTSAKITEGRKWWLLGFVIVIVLLNIVGMLLLLVGLLVSIPVTMLALARVYVQLHEHRASHE